MKIQVMNRFDAIRYCHRPHAESAAMISVSSPDEQYSTAPFISDENGVKAILRLCFEDIDPKTDEQLRTAMTDADAEKIGKFLKCHDKEDLLIVHCDGGISRSAGIAGAIFRAWTGNDSMAIFHSGRYQPNMWCYRKTLSQLLHGKAGT